MLSRRDGGRREKINGYKASKMRINVAAGAKGLHLRRYFIKAILPTSRTNISSAKWIV
jgi:hypothetical protein